MSARADQPAPAVRAAAARLRAAVHDLARASTSSQPDLAALGRAEELVRAAAAELDGEVLPRWWQKPPMSDADRELRSYDLRSVFQGELHPFSAALRWEDQAGPDGQRGLAFEVTLSNLYEGPPRSLHGGYLAGLFDELLGAVQVRAQGVPGWTGRLAVRYRSMTPLDTELRFEGWVVEGNGRRLRTTGTCRADGKLCATADALFVEPVPRGR